VTQPHTRFEPHPNCSHGRFIDSEADLDSAIKSLLPLAQSPSIAYPELVKSGALGQLIDLMSHENLDIVIDVVELLHELTDEDVGGEGDEDDVDDDEATRTESKDGALKLLIDSLVSLVTSPYTGSNDHTPAGTFHNGTPRRQFESHERRGGL
jgi:Catenin-beta-like, Arm-motif containing nuclear